MPVPDHITIVDYADPTHVPYMVAEAMVERVGNLAELLDDDEYHAACLAALDAMPDGRDAVHAAVEETVRHLAVVGGWSGWVIDPATGQYPALEPEEDEP